MLSQLTPLPLQFFLIKYDYLNSTNANATTPTTFNLSTFTPDNTTIFTKKGNLLSLGDITLPADEDIKPQQVLNPNMPQEGLLNPEGVLEEVLGKINRPVVGLVGNESEGARTEGVSWSVPQPKQPSCKCGVGGGRLG